MSFLSLHPHLEELIQFIYKNLPNQPNPPFIPNIGFDRNGKVKTGFEVNRDAFQSGNDNPSVSTRDLSDTGERTSLLYLRRVRGIFWLDLESSLLRKLDELLKDANSPDATIYVKQAVNYSLGLVMEFKP